MCITNLYPLFFVSNCQLPDLSSWCIDWKDLSTRTVNTSRLAPLAVEGHALLALIQHYYKYFNVVIVERFVSTTNKEKVGFAEIVKMCICIFVCIFRKGKKYIC